MLLGPLCCSEVPGIYLLDLTIAAMGWSKNHVAVYEMHIQISFLM